MLPLVVQSGSTVLTLTFKLQFDSGSEALALAPLSFFPEWFIGVIPGAVPRPCALHERVADVVVVVVVADAAVAEAVGSHSVSELKGGR